MLIDSAVHGTKGNLKDTKALVQEMRKANYNSVRGKFQYNINHHPIQDFYLLQGGEGGNKGGVEMHIGRRRSRSTRTRTTKIAR